MARSPRGRGPGAALSALAPLAALAALAVTGCGGQAPLALPATPPASAATAQAPTQSGQSAQAAQSGQSGQSAQSAQPAPADTSLSGVHACTLIPKATVAALGQLSSPAAPSPDGLTCFFNLTGGPSYIVNVISRSQYELTKTIDTSEAQAGLVQLTRTHGLGDEGFAISSTNGGPVYNVLAAKGGVAVNVTLDSVEPATEQRADQLVAAALAGL